MVETKDNMQQSKKDEQGRVRVSQMTPEEKNILRDIKQQLDELVKKYSTPYPQREHA